MTLSPNTAHYEHLQAAIEASHVRRIYIEKPLCASAEELSLLPTCTEKTVQVGFQFLQMAAVRHALALWREDLLGEPIHFSARYLHSSYLDKSYRDKRQQRLLAAPVGGAMSDLGAHVLSMLLAFLGPDLKVVKAMCSGSFDDVMPHSDLCTQVMLLHPETGAIGHVTASRISAGNCDTLELEVLATKGAIRFSTKQPDAYWVNRSPTKDEWHRCQVASKFSDNNQFPASYAPAGWLRSVSTSPLSFSWWSRSPSLFPRFGPWHCRTGLNQ